MGLLLQFILLHFLTQHVSSMQRLCLDSERSALLQLKESLVLNRSASAYPKLGSWKLEGQVGGDCCSWYGVECDDNTGHVIGLDLSSCFLHGSIDSNSSLFQLHHLRKLNLSDNDFDGSEIPSAIGNLESLSILDVGNCFFSGQIPTSLANLTELTYLSLAENEFSPTTLSWLDKLTKLAVLDVASTNSFGDVLPCVKNLTRLTDLRLYGNQFSSQIPSWLGNLTRLTTLELGNNKFWGLVPESIFTLIKLESLGLQYNVLTGTYKSDSFLNLKNLKWLQLSGNKFSLVSTAVMNVTIPKFTILTLRSCNLFEFPNFLSGQDELEYLSLSGNKIHGFIPEWIWGLSAQTLEVLHLRENLLTGFQQPVVVSPWTNLRVLDLRSNKLQGSLPIPPASVYQYFVSNNLLEGEIPSMICNLPCISILDMSNNSFSGMLPPCLSNLSKSLSVLNLQSNNFHGPIPQACEKGSKLRMVDLSQNQLSGYIPRSLVNCNMLEFLNLGNNQIEDTFPLWLGRLQELRVLTLRHNGFHGEIGKPKSKEFPKLRILDLSSNKFSGHLPSRHFQLWEAMKVVDVGKLRYLQVNASFQSLERNWYFNFSYSMTMTSKGIEIKYEKIQDVLVAIDLSSNRFEGGIPEDIQILKAVQFLNLSDNLLSGPIPSSLANLTQLQALDLSRNNLYGEIPGELTRLTFLGLFNVSHNQLTGPIPQGKQFGTFESNSFEGNTRLCGNPSSNKCYPEGLPPSPPSLTKKDGSGDSWLEFGWQVILLGYGSGVVIGLVIGYFFNPMKHNLFVKYFGRKMQNRTRGRRN